MYIAAILRHALLRQHKKVFGRTNTASSGVSLATRTRLEQPQHAPTGILCGTRGESARVQACKKGAHEIRNELKNRYHATIRIILAVPRCTFSHVMVSVHVCPVSLPWLVLPHCAWWQAAHNIPRFNSSGHQSVEGHNVQGCVIHALLQRQLALPETPDQIQPEFRP